MAQEQGAHAGNCSHRAVMAPGQLKATKAAAATSREVLGHEIAVGILNKSWATVHAAQIVCTHSVVTLSTVHCKDSAT